MRTTTDYKMFQPRDYLNTYYTQVDRENSNLLDFFHEQYKTIPKGGLLLELGGGPTIYSLISAAPKVKEIHFSDYSEANLEEVKKWVRNDKDAFNWDIFIEYVLKLEGIKKPKKKDIEKRKTLLRSKIKVFFKINLKKRDIFLGRKVAHYDIISVFSVLELIVKGERQLLNYLRKVVKHIKKNKHFIVGYIYGASYYLVGDKPFYSYEVGKYSFVELLKKLGFKEKNITNLDIPANEDTFEHGYDGLMILHAVKP